MKDKLSEYILQKYRNDIVNKNIILILLKKGISFVSKTTEFSFGFGSWTAVLDFGFGSRTKELNFGPTTILNFWLCNRTTVLNLGLGSPIIVLNFRFDTQTTDGLHNSSSGWVVRLQY